MARAVGEDHLQLVCGVWCVVRVWVRGRRVAYERGAASRSDARTDRCIKHPPIDHPRVSKAHTRCPFDKHIYPLSVLKVDPYLIALGGLLLLRALLGRHDVIEAFKMKTKMQSGL